ncbi:MAG: hypothetical protein C5B54_03915 [Acidobacteria bacterium]|nr:MAG: hypothetical protein C5B54_03915 [Acidobacteriota bacterium]
MALRVGIDFSPLTHGNMERGIGVYATNLLEALTEADNTTEYILLANRDIRNFECFENLPVNFRLHELPYPRLGRATFLYTHQFLLGSEVKRLKLDVLHCLSVPMNPSHAQIPWRQTVPTIVTVYDLIPLHMKEQFLREFRHRLFYRFMLNCCRRAAHLLAISNSTRDDFIREGIASPDQISVIPLGTPKFPAPQQIDLPQLPGSYILHIGGADPQKNQQAVLTAFALLCQDHSFKHDLVLVGSHHLPTQLAIETRVHRLSHLSRANLRSVLEKASLLLFPSLQEGFGLPILEAMSCGVPVIVSNIPAIQETAGDAALLVDPTNCVQLAQAANQILRNRTNRQQLQQLGKSRVQQFDWRHTAEQTMTIYKQFGRKK